MVKISLKILKIQVFSLILTLLQTPFTLAENHPKSSSSPYIPEPVCVSLIKNIKAGKADTFLTYFKQYPKEINLNCQSEGETPLILAIRYGKTPLLQSLLDLGADANIQSKSGSLPLIESLTPHHYVLDYKSEPMPEKCTEYSLFEYERRQIQKRDLHIRLTPVERAKVRLLLNRGAKINLWADIENPLLAAVNLGDPVLREELIQRGADINLLDSQGDSILMRVLENYDERMRKYKQDLSRFYRNYSGTDLARQLELYLPRLNEQLIYDVETVRWLIDKGALTHFFNQEGFSALHFAGATNNQELYELIWQQDKGEHLKKSDPNLIFYAMQRHPNVAMYMIRSGLVDPNYYNAKYPEPTPLHQAVEIKNLELIQLLLQKGANPYQKNEEGETPIHRAQYPEMKRLLVRESKFPIPDSPGPWDPWRKDDLYF